MRRGGAAASEAATIGFVCDELSTDPWNAIGLDGVRERAWANGLTVTVITTRGDADMEAAALAQLAGMPLAGLIYATINTRLVEAPAWTGAPPIVLLNCHAAQGGFASVVPGEVAGGHAATDVPHPRRPQAHRLRQRRSEHGGRAPSPARVSSGARDRRPAVRSPSLVREGNWEPLSGYQAARALMALDQPPTAIFCANDLMAVGAYEALREAGLRIPDDIAVMGYDDRAIAEHLHPPLTTVLLPHFEMGALAAELLIDAAGGDPPLPGRSRSSARS